MSDLRIKEVSFSRFRNYRDYLLRDIGSLTVFVGKNGIGKTNILEGIQLLTSCSSFRNAQSAQLIGEGFEKSSLNMECSDGNRQFKVELSIEPGKKSYLLNGKKKTTADIKGMLPSVAFTPDDLQLVKKSSSQKRAALDNLGTQLSRSYHIVNRDYEKILRYKNKLLKEEADTLLLQSANDTLIFCGAQLLCFRLSLFNRMVPLASHFYEQISHSEEKFSATYLPSWLRLKETGVDTDFAHMGYDGLNPEKTLVKQEMEENIDRYFNEERNRKRSLIGPHADQITFYLGGKDASQFASQGQQRSMVLAWKLAEVETVKRSLGTLPVLLLDDVMSELDATRREKLVDFVTDDIQTFITATDLDSFSNALLTRAHIVHLE